MTRGRIPQNPEGVTNQDNQNPSMDGGLAEAVRLLTDMFKQQQHKQAHVPRPEVRDCLCEKFLIHRYPSIFDNEEPLKAAKWIMDLKRTYEICGCTEDQKVLYVVYLF